MTSSRKTSSSQSSPQSDAAGTDHTDQHHGTSRDENEAETAPADFESKEKKEHSSKKKKKHAEQADENPIKKPSKRQRTSENADEIKLVKRTKLTEASSESPKRKADLPTAHVIDPSSSSLDEPLLDRIKRRKTQEEQIAQPPAVSVEYEDITAEVDARMQKRHERKEHERKREKGIIDKRKRQSNDSLREEAVQDEEAAAAVDKPSRKKKKHRHSAEASGGRD